MSSSAKTKICYYTHNTHGIMINSSNPIESKYKSTYRNIMAGFFLFILLAMHDDFDDVDDDNVGERC